MKNRYFSGLALAVAVVVLLGLWLRTRPAAPDIADPARDEPQPAAEPAVGERTEAFDLDAHLSRVRDWDPETGFDYAAHEAALKALGPVHHETMLAAAEAVHALREFEAQSARQTAEHAAVADALEALRDRRETLLRQQREAFALDASWVELRDAVTQAEMAVRDTRIELQPALDGPRRIVAEERGSPEAEQAREAVQEGVLRLREVNEVLRERRSALREREEALSLEQPEARAATEALTEVNRAIADQEETLAGQFAQDAGWRALKEQAQAAEDEVTAARMRLQMAIRARMQVEHEIAQSQRDATESAVP